MKTVRYLCLLAVLICGLAVSVTAQTPVFSWGTGSTFVTKAEMIKPFYREPNSGNLPLTLKQSFQVKSPDRKYEYTVKLYNYTGWEDEAGDFTVIEVYIFDKRIVRLENYEGWALLSPKFQKLNPNSYFFEMPLKNDAVALVFVGYPYASDAEWMTVIGLCQNHGTMVFNRHVAISDIEGTIGAANMKIIGGDYSSEQSLKRVQMWIEKQVLYVNGLKTTD
ncbi:MAG: hypothetical protein IJC16_00850 [Rikenellaceae bacterium]|nr:hypothetical protein [Rikenellaceae bacterium]